MRNLLLLLPVFACSLARADERATDTAWRITLECRMVVLPQKDALPILEKSNDGANGAEVWEAIARMLDSGQAALAAELITSQQSGTRAVTDTNAEIRWPADYQPLRLPDREPGQQVEPILKAWPFVGAPPADFDVRSIGESFEAEASVTADGGWIDLNLTAWEMSLQKWDSFDFGELPGGERTALQLPDFHIAQTVNRFRCKSGEKLLLGMHRLPEPGNDFEFFLLHVRAEKAGPLRPEAPSQPNQAIPGL